MKFVRRLEHKATNARASVWRDADEALREAEVTINAGIVRPDKTASDKPVDHFRPKIPLSRMQTHPGYTWLAFEWQKFPACRAPFVTAETA